MDLIGPIILLKLRLTFRRTRGAWQVVGMLLMLLFFILPVGVGGGLFTFFGLQELVGSGRKELLHFVLGAMWMFWIVFPIIGFSLNQSYDLTKLFIYPIRRPVLFFANVLACIVDPTLLILLPSLGVIVYHHSPTPTAGAVAVLAVTIFIVQTIALSQALLWALMNVLRSRRIRDWAILLGPLIGLGFYVMPQIMIRRSRGFRSFESLLDWEPSTYFGYLPPGLAAHAMNAAERGAYLLAAGYLLACLACLGATIWLGAYVLGKLHSGEIGGSPTKTAKEKEDAPPRLLQRVALTPLGVMALKEARYYWRDPRHKAMLIIPLFPLAWVYVMSRNQMGGAFTSPVSGTVFVAMMVLMSFSQLFHNIFGIDREGLRLLFVTPCSREKILMGKNAAAVAVAGLTTSVATLVGSLAFKQPALGLAMAPVILASAIIFAAIGNLTSVFFPMRMTRKGENPFTSSSSKGCMAALVGMVAMLVTMIVAAPIVAAVGVALALHQPWIFAIAIPGSFAYAVAVYMVLLKKVASPALMTRETNILEECLTGEPT